jgi:RND family efflux transporter MFP subunit
VGDLQAKTATVWASRANVARLESLQSFNQLVAPFDGVVTTRGLDIGQLVTAGGNLGRPLYTVSDIHRVRIYVNVPQALLDRLKPGLTASLVLPQYASETFPASLTATSHAVTPETRSALVELQADNPEGTLWPGSYAEVHFRLEVKERVLLIPATALFFGPRGIEVVLLTSGSKVKLSKVQLGRNLGREVEVLSGLSPDAAVIDSPPESLITGQAVRIARKNGDKADTDLRHGRPET